MKFTLSFLLLILSVQSMKIKQTSLVQKKVTRGEATLLQAFQEHKEQTKRKSKQLNAKSAPTIKQYIQGFDDTCGCTCCHCHCDSSCGYPYGESYCNQHVPCTDPYDPYCDMYDDPYDNPYMDPYDHVNYVMPHDDPYVDEYDPYVDPCDPENYQSPYVDPNGKKYKPAKCTENIEEPWAEDDDDDETDGDYPDPYVCPCEDTGSNPYDNDYDPYQDELEDHDVDPYGPDVVLQLSDMHYTYPVDSADANTLYLSPDA